MNPELRIRHPDSRLSERRYVYGQVLVDWLGCKVDLVAEDRSDLLIQLPYGSPWREIRIADEFLATPAADWLRPVTVPLSTPSRLIGAANLARPELTHDVMLPWSPRDRPCAVRYREDGSMEIGADLFGAIFFFLTRYEEIAAPETDRFGRYPAQSAWAVRAGLVERPLVDEYVAVIRGALQRAWPILRLATGTYRLALSHDVDLPLRHRWAPLPRMIGGQLRDLARGKGAAAAVQGVSDWYAVRHRGAVDRDPYNTFETLADFADQIGQASAFYFIADRPAGNIDAMYEIEDPFIMKLMNRLSQRGMEIGLHPSFNTFLDATRTCTEFARLQSACRTAGIAQSKWGGRQHFLRWRAPLTWRNWECAGLSYDSTVGFAERAGFRAGTSREFKCFDLLETRTMTLIERPLILMDSTVLNYMRLGPADAIELGLRLREECRRHGGQFTLLWHNSNLTTEAHWLVFSALAGV